MIRFRERNLSVVGLISIIVLAVLIAGALEFDKLPFFHNDRSQAADFASAGGLVVGDVVTVHGVKVGTVTRMSLRAGGDGRPGLVRVTFTVPPSLHLGAATTAQAKVLSPIGTEYLEIVPAGPGNDHAVIPMARTTIPYTLVADLSDLGSQIQQYNIPQLQAALQAGAGSLSTTQASEVASAFSGLSKLSQILGGDKDALASIVSQGAGLTHVLSDRSAQLVDLVSQSNVVLQVLAQRKAAIGQLLSATASLGQEITTILTTNHVPLEHLLNSLQTVSGVLAQDSTDIGNAIPLLSAFSKYAANSTGSGAFVDATVPTLLVPDNVLAACAAKGAYPSANPQVGCRK